MSRINREVVELLERDVNVRRLVDKLFFDADNLELAALKQPKLYLEAGKFRAQSALRLSTLRRKLARKMGELAISYRKRKGGKETSIKNAVSQDREVQHYQKQVDEAEVYDEFAKQLVEAYKERLMVIAILTKLKVSEMSSQLRLMQSEDTVKAMRKRAHKTRKAFSMLEGDDDDI